MGRLSYLKSVGTVRLNHAPTQDGTYAHLPETMGQAPGKLDSLPK